jgi:hypothetical protein
MSLNRVQSPEVGSSISTSFVQRMNAAVNFDGLAPKSTVPAASEQDFVAFQDTVSGEHVYSNPGPTTPEATLKGTSGGLFEFGHKQPIVIEQVLIVFGASTNYTITIVTPHGEVAYAGGTAVTSALLGWGGTEPNWRPLLMPGDKLKLVTSGGAVSNAVARVSVSLEQRHS